MTEVEFTRMLSELSEVATALNKESDTINGIIERFQKMLAALNIGIEASVRLDMGQGTLWWTKASGEWQLMVPDERDYLRPLLDQARDVRIAALGKFPDLVTALKWKADQALEAIRKAKDYVK